MGVGWSEVALENVSGFKVTFQWLIESRMVQKAPDVSLRKEHDSTEVYRRGRNKQTKNRKFSFGDTTRNQSTNHNQCLDSRSKQKTKDFLAKSKTQTQLLTIECKHKSSTSNCHNKPFLNVITYAQILSIQLISFVNFLKFIFLRFDGWQKKRVWISLVDFSCMKAYLFNLVLGTY